MADDRIQFIADNLQENLEVEVKNWLNGLQTNGDKSTLAKEIIALANSGGGYIFIGFEDKGSTFLEIPPNEGELGAYTQDAIAGIVQRYVNPPCQCRLEFVSVSESTYQHPVIVVPGGHRTPLFAIKGGPNGELESSNVYIRRPGGNSEQARTQDDWEKLIERLIKSRHSELLSAMREILNPSSKILAVQESSIQDWHAKNYSAWQSITDEFKEDDPRRLTLGHWSVSFAISPFQTESLSQLNTALERKMPTHSGWPPFTYINRAPISPKAAGNSITAYLGDLQPHEQAADRADICDYWCVSRGGKGFMLRPMQEDSGLYLNSVPRKPVVPLFDWTLPIYRMSEVFKYIEVLSGHFSAPDATFQIILSYKRTKGRRLEQAERYYHLRDGATCNVDVLENRIEASVSEISTNIEELVFSLLAPIYEQFEFTELPKILVTKVVEKVLSFR